VAADEEDREQRERAYRLIGEIVDGIVAQTCARHYLAPPRTYPFHASQNLPRFRLTRNFLSFALKPKQSEGRLVHSILLPRQNSYKVGTWG